MTFSTFSQCEKKHFQPAGEEVREAGERVDFIYPKVFFPSNKIYKTLGKEYIQNMVFKHHNYLKKTVIGDMFAQDEETFIKATEKTALFFVEALGGDRDFSTNYGHPALRERHFRFDIDEKARDIWLMTYKKVLKEIEFPKEFLEEFWNWIEPLSIRMINKRTTVLEPTRYVFETIKHEFDL